MLFNTTYKALDHIKEFSDEHFFVMSVNHVEKVYSRLVIAFFVQLIIILILLAN